MATSRDRTDKRVAVIGYGTAGRFFHAPLIAATPGLSLAAVVTGNPDRAADIRAAYPDTEVLPDVGQLWARADAFDSVVIASPNAHHADQAQAAVEAGLAVVVDKPLAADVAQARRVINAAAERGVPLTVFQNRRWDADFLTLHQLLDAGRLGPVRRFESRFERWRPQPKAGWKRDGGPQAAGGILFDLGSHLIDQARVLFGPVATVYAELEPRYADSAVDDDSFVALTHASGVRSHLWMSSVAPDLGPRFRVLGADAAYVKYGLDGQEDRLRGGGDPRAENWGVEAEADWGRLGAGFETARVASVPGDYPAFYTAWAACLHGGAPPPVNPRDAMATLAIIEAAREASEQRRVIAVPDSAGAF